MIKINKNLLNVQQVDNFEEVSRRVNEYKINNPNNKLLNLGVGDVSKPIIKEVIDEMNKAINELGNIDTFKGYGYFYGHSFLKKKII
ncbi:MAG: LL-diaminopimelate aminotransferase, partial [Bacilli bacterium]|nr:LL-diaminopimelate aminotransferase [Bacilli bacterium]